MREKQLADNAVTMILRSYCILLLSVSLNNAAASIHRSACRRDALFKLEYKDKILMLQTGSALSLRTSQGLSKCAKECIILYLCLSFNFNKVLNDNNCQLLNFNKTSHDRKLENQPNWNHYGTVTQVKPLNNSQLM